MLFIGFLNISLILLYFVVLKISVNVVILFATEFGFLGLHYILNVILKVHVEVLLLQILFSIFLQLFFVVVFFFGTHEIVFVITISILPLLIRLPFHLITLMVTIIVFIIFTFKFFVVVNKLILLLTYLLVIITILLIIIIFIRPFRLLRPTSFVSFPFFRGIKLLYIFAGVLSWFVLR